MFRRSMLPGLLLAVLLLVGSLLAGCATPPEGPGRDPSAPSGHPAAPVGTQATRADRHLARDFVAFALEPKPGTLSRMALAPGGVWLGLGDDLSTVAGPRRLLRADAWRITTGEGFRGRTGSLSALQTLAHHARRHRGGSGTLQNRGLQVSTGPHRQCARPISPAPPSLGDYRRISISPVPGSLSSCLDWFAVDLYLDPRGRVAAITLDLWEP